MQIQACENWREQRKESGEFWHPVFFENYTDETNYPELIEQFNLETTGWWLGDGYPRETELKLRDIYDNDTDQDVDCFDGIRGWDPDIKNMKNPEGWFILWICDTEEGPYVCWAKVKTDTPEQAQ